MSRGARMMWALARRVYIVFTPLILDGDDDILCGAGVVQ
jgi:hypothetical protein